MQAYDVQPERPAIRGRVFLSVRTGVAVDFQAIDTMRPPTADALALVGEESLPPLVSVLMAVRDGERFLDDALASLQRQTLARFELIVVDNASRDSTPALLDAWGEREPRLRTIRCEGGLAECLNRAAELARAPFLARLDADDVAEPDRLEAQYSAMVRNPEVGVLGTAVELIDLDGRRLGSVVKPGRAQRRHGPKRSPMVNSSTMMRADAFRRAGGYRHGLNICEDADLWSRMLEFCQADNLPDKLTKVRVHGSSLTARRPQRMAIAVLCVKAAAEARRLGLPEPFRAGSPRLRAALPLLGLSRRQGLRRVAMLAAARRASAALMAAPLPASARAAARRVLLGSRAPLLFWRWLARAGRPQPSLQAAPPSEAGNVGGIHSPPSSTCGGRYSRPLGIFSNSAPVSSAR